MPEFEAAEGIILEIGPATSPQLLRLQVLSPERGVFACLQRIEPGNFPPGTDPRLALLFDSADMDLEKSRQTQAFFVRAYQPQRRCPFLAAEPLSSAGHLARRFAGIFVKNFFSAGECPEHYDLVGKVLLALETGLPPITLYLRAFFRLLQLEGHPVAEAWLQALPPQYQNQITNWLQGPLQDGAEAAGLAMAVNDLELWVAGHTELRLPQEPAFPAEIFPEAAAARSQEAGEF